MRLDRVITLGLVNPLRRARSMLAKSMGLSAERPPLSPAPSPFASVSRSENRGQTPGLQQQTTVPLIPSPDRLPILMYHSVSDTEEIGLAPYYQVCTSPTRFAEHMQWLADAGWRGVTLSQGLAWLRGEGARGKGQGAEHKEAGGKGQERKSPEQEQSGKSARLEALPRNAIGQVESDQEKESLTPFASVSRQRELGTNSGFAAENNGVPLIPSPPAKLVAITFDDGFRDFHTAAFPVLQRHRFSATMYLSTGFIGDERRTLNSHQCLTWSEVRELAAAGIEFGSHTVSHPMLVELAPSGIETELRDSKSVIEQQLACPVRTFAYPYAFPSADKAFARRFREILHQAGYESGVTTIVGRADAGNDPLQLPRLPANTADDRALLLAKLEGAYDWVSIPQHLNKWAGRWFRPSSRPATLAASSR